MPLDKNMPVLVVDDHRDMITILRFALKTLGFTKIDEAAHGADALRLLAQRDYRLVISDLRMEPVDGLELLRSVRRADGSSKMPFILMTADKDQDVIHQAKAEGANHFLPKPFNVDLLRDRIERVFGDID